MKSMAFMLERQAVHSLYDITSIYDQQGTQMPNHTKIWRSQNITKTVILGHTPKLIPTLLKKTKGTLERKIAEAFYIGKLHPDLNSKDELQEVKAFCV